jgi:hypothetical protein
MISLHEATGPEVIVTKEDESAISFLAKECWPGELFSQSFSSALQQFL